MATRLIQTLAFVDVPAGGSAALPHTLNIAGTPVTPDLVMLDTPGFTAVATELQVGVTNTTGSTASVNVWAERKHTIPRELGALALSPSPFIVGAAGPALAGVARDATRGVYCPADATQWNTVQAVAGIASGPPVATWLMQEAAGSLIDSIGAFDFAPNGAPLYQQPIPGWSRLAVSLAATSVDRFTAALAQGSTVSALILLYARIDAVPVAARTIAQHPNVYAEVSAAPVIQANGGTLVPGTVNPGTDFFPLFLRSNVTLSAEGVYAFGEDLVPVWSPDTISTIALGSTVANGGAVSFNYGSAWTGADAELITAQLAALLTTLAW